VIKMVQAMHHGVVPKTLHIDTPSSNVDWEAGAVTLLTEAVEWPDVAGQPRRAGISSFSVSGTNAHTILEYAPPAAVPSEDAPDAPSVLPLLVSARSERALDAQIESLDAVPATLDVAYSLATGRALFDHRAVVLAGRDGRRGAATRGRVTSGRLAFVFSGQGSQRPGMGRGLYERFPVFATALDDVLSRLDPGLRDVMWGEDAAALADTGYAQPALFAVEVALFRLTESFGVRPDVLIGHSIGELAAAHVAGVLSLDDACAVVSARARLMAALPTGGAMVAVRASETEVAPYLGPDVSVAAVNSPDGVVLSGTEAAVLAVADRFEKKTRLRTSHAFHSALMEPMLAEFAAAIDGVEAAEPTIPVVSTVAGAGRFGDVAYWVRQVREAVRFADAIATAQPDRVLEIGPDGALCAVLPDLPAVPVLRRDVDDEEATLRAMATLHVAGVPVDWSTCLTGGRMVDLPTYPFQRERYWPEGGGALTDPSGLGQTPAVHPLLGAAVALADGTGVLLTGRLSLAAQPWLADHRVGETVLAPASVLLELAVRAGDEVGCPSVRDLTVVSPMVLPDRGGVQVQVRAGTPDASGAREVHVHSRPDSVADAPWTTHATGTLTPGTGAGNADFAAAWPPPGAEAVDVDGCYDRFAAFGFDCGPVFQGLHAAWRRGEEVFAEVALPERVTGANAFGLHPALLDAALHALLLTRPAMDRPRSQFAWEGVSLHAGGASALRVRLTDVDGQVTIDAADPAGRPVLSVAALHDRPMSDVELPRQADTESLLVLRWAPATADTTLAEPVIGVLGKGLDGLGDLTVVRGDLETLAGADPVPGNVLVAFGGEDATVRAITARALELVQTWLTDERFAASRLVLVTRGAVGPNPSDLTASAVWGLVRSAQAEHPGRFALLDVESDGDVAVALPLLADEPQAIVRNGTAHAARLARFASTGELAPPAEPWRLVTRDGTDEPTMLAAPELTEQLPDAAVRLRVTAAAVDGHAASHTGVVGVVTETGPAVRDLNPGDRVLGLVPGGPASVAVVPDERMLVRVPEDWSDETAASVPRALTGAEVLTSQEEVKLPTVDLAAADPEEIRTALTDLLELVTSAKVEPHPVRSWPAGRAPEAFRSENSGELVLTMPQPWDREGTVLITGGAGGLGAALARHLVVEHGHRHIVLASRRGTAPNGLCTELAEHGATVTVAACDASDETAVRTLINGLDRPLTAVVHAAGVLDDGVIARLTPERLDAVLAPKVDGAWNLHEATKHLPLAGFVLYSSVAGVLGTPGQANYAAANTYLDALAAHRQARGLPAVSIAWGPWEEVGMAADTGVRTGPFTPIPVTQGLAMFDTAMTMTPALLVGLILRPGSAAGGPIPPIMHELAGGGRRQAAGTGQTQATAAQDIAGLRPQDQLRYLVDLIGTEAATVLAHSATDKIGRDDQFKDLGFESLTAVEFGNRLSAATGLRMPSTLIFDYPTPTALAEYLRGELAPEPENVEGPTVLAELDRLEAAMATSTPDELTRTGITTRLRQLLDRWNTTDNNSGTPANEAESVARRIEAASTDEIFAFIDSELRKPND
jgi:polyketide synthase 12